MAAKQLKKRNKPHSKKTRLGRAKRLATLKTKRSAIGVILAWNSTEGEHALLYPSGFEKAKKLLGGDEIAGFALADILEKWKFNWHATAVVYCTNGNQLTDQPADLTADNTTGAEIGEMLEELIEELKKLCNPNHITEWGFRATITGVPNGN